LFKFADITTDSAYIFSPESPSIIHSRLIQQILASHLKFLGAKYSILLFTFGREALKEFHSIGKG
jgi:hypothetical protein